MPSGPKKRRAARNKLNKCSSTAANLIVPNNADNEMIPKVTSVEHESKDVELVKEVKEDHVLIVVACDNVVGSGGRVEEDDNNNVLKGNQTAPALKGDDGGVSSGVAAAEEEEDNAASEVAESFLGIPRDDAVANTLVQHALDGEQVEEAKDGENAPKVESGVVGVDVRAEDDKNAVKGNEIVRAQEDVDEVAAADEDDGAFGWKKEEWDFISVVKEMLCAGFKDECAFEEYFGKVMGLVDEWDGDLATTTTTTKGQQFKALLLLHKHLIKKGALI